jgi:hypothetical protein
VGLLAKVAARQPGSRRWDDGGAWREDYTAHNCYQCTMKACRDVMVHISKAYNLLGFEIRGAPTDIRPSCQGWAACAVLEHHYPTSSITETRMRFNIDRRRTMAKWEARSQASQARHLNFSQKPSAMPGLDRLLPRPHFPNMIHVLLFDICRP